MPNRPASNPAASGTLVIGVTGGMASGKSTLARMIAGRGIVHLDADKIVHDLMRHDRATIIALAEAFPEALTSPKVEGSIDRSKLAAIISSHPEKLSQLETILHPRVRAVEEAAILRAQRQRARAIVLDIPLLFETDAQALCDVVIVAHAPLAHRRARAFRRPGMTEEKWQRLISRQLPDPIRVRAGDIVIPTTLGKAVTRRMVAQLMKQWKFR